MTCIAGLAQGGHVYIGGDSATFNGQTVFIGAGGKVFRRDEFIIGSAGARRMNDLVRFSLELPPPEAETDLDVYMTTVFATAVRDALRKGGNLEVDASLHEMADGMMLVGVRGSLYIIDSDFAAVRVIDGIAAVGSGMDVALGALHVTEDLPPEKRIQRALEAAERWTDGVRAPFTIESI